ncbi:MAG: winged helix-turn-helix transcriptional regulator [Myxococcota bacterium]|nr:winged helix-turn-helix transcriptional regulator [Myxococcota bacterium]
MCLAADPAVRLRDVATRAGITERAVLRIVSDLEQDGYVMRVREGRRNRYEIDTSRPLRHPVDAERSVECLLDLMDAA